MTGMPNLNFPAFHAAAARLRASGLDVVNPAELDDADPAPLEWHQYLRRDIAQLIECDSLCLLPGWEKSKGARLELHIAQELGMQVTHLDVESEAAAHSSAAQLEQA
jgi:hypothetical protein